MLHMYTGVYSPCFVFRCKLCVLEINYVENRYIKYILLCLLYLDGNNNNNDHNNNSNRLTIIVFTQHYHHICY